MKRVRLVEQRRSEEAKFTSWIGQNPDRQKRYGTVLSDFDRLYKNYYATAQRDRLLRTMPGVSTPISQAPMPVFKELVDAVAAVQAGKALTDSKRSEYRRSTKIASRWWSGICLDIFWKR